MPKFEATAADQGFDFVDGADDIDFSAEILRESDVYIWDTTAGHRVTAFGAFTTSGPLGGVVTEVEIDLGTDGDTDIVINSIANADITALVAGHSSFWETLFAQDDEFQGPSMQDARLAGDFVNGGDGATGGDDTFTQHGHNVTRWFGDHYVGFGDIASGAGGSDQFTITGDLSAFSFPRVAGDINTVFGGVSYLGGDDLVEFNASGVHSLGNQVSAFGDAESVAGVLKGGDDVIGATASHNIAVFGFGDAQALFDDGQISGGGDTIEGGVGSDSLAGDVGGIAAFATSGAKFAGGDDTLRGGDGMLDKLWGDFEKINAGAQILAANITFGDDLIEGGAGVDRIFGDYEADDAGILAASAGGNDELHGGPGDDDMFGNGGNDRIAPDDGDDAVDGGAGADTLDYSPDTMGVTIDLGAGTASGVWAGTDTFSNMEHVTTGSGGDAITGDGARNIVNAGAGVDTVNGLGGDDLINGGGGADVITGGDGENVLRGQAHNDHVTGGGEADEIAGGDGADTLIGGAGGDDILGQGDVDDIMGGAGDDELRGGQGDDVISGGGDDDLLFGQGNNDTLMGGAGDDELNGGAGLDDLMGGTGADILRGGNARDELDGGTGDDTLIGGAGADFYVFALGYGADQVNDFADDADALRLNENLWGGGLTVAQVIAQFASQQGAHTVFDFGGGDALTVLNTTTAIFQDDIVFV